MAKKITTAPSAVEKNLELDLRKEMGLQRSHLLHRLILLKVPWGEFKGSGSSKGTFKEIWRLQWQPELAIQLIEASVWGTTIAEAATQFVCHQLDKTNDLAQITLLVNQTLLADLPVAIGQAMNCLETEAAVASDVVQLMAALPSLAEVLRYGSVRRFEMEVITHVVDTLSTRICIGLPVACHSLDEAAAEEMYQWIINTDNALVKTIKNPAQVALWHETLQKLLTQDELQGLIAGCSTRLLFDSHVISLEQTAQQMSFALSKANEPAQAGAWIAGFLRGSGLMLLHDDSLWTVLDQWICELNGPLFIELLPLLRRTFATFPAGERRQMGEKVQQQATTTEPKITALEESPIFNQKSAQQSLVLIAKILGLEYRIVSNK